VSEHAGRNAVSGFFLHIHPRKVPAETIRFTLSFGLGGMAATLFLALVITGILQLLGYIPRMERAYGSVLQMYDNGSLAGFIRNIHYWAGNLLIVVCGLHLSRVFLTGALVGPRRINWVIGIMLFGLILAANFTGYLLPGDQLAYWAVTIFTSMLSYLPALGPWLVTTLRGGDNVSSATLANFFAIHVGLIPFIALFLLVYHFWLIRKARGLIRSARVPGDETMVAAMPHLVFRELLIGLSLLAVLLSFSALVDAPLGSPATPGSSPNPTKAAWYFMGLQELLLHLHPVFVVCVLPALTIGALILLPFVKGAVLPGGQWFGGRDGRRVAAWSVLAGFACAGLAVLADSKIIISGTPPAMPWLSRGLVPVFMYGAVLAGWYLFWRTLRRRSRAEATMALMVFAAGSIVSLTVIGYWFRGEGMALVIPFLG